MVGKLLSRFHGHSFKGSPQLKFVISGKKIDNIRLSIRKLSVPKSGLD
jgi:hypothetical protein